MKSKYLLLYQRHTLLPFEKPARFVAEEHETSFFGRDRMRKIFEGSSDLELAHRIDSHYGCAIYIQIKEIRTIPASKLKMGEDFARAPVSIDELLRIAEFLNLEITPGIQKTKEAAIPLKPGLVN